MSLGNHLVSNADAHSLRHLSEVLPCGQAVHVVAMENADVLPLHVAHEGQRCFRRLAVAAANAHQIRVLKGGVNRDIYWRSF